MTHDFKDMLFCKDNFFVNPDKVLALFDQESFFKSASYPGMRTGNLLESDNVSAKNFGLFFAKKLCDEIFPGVHGLMIDVRFHLNRVYSNDIANQGWIHSDEADLAGLVYLSKNERSLDTGTSLFVKDTQGDFAVKDFTSRREFNLTDMPSAEYIDDLQENHKNFIETVRVGNVYNRLVAYDAEIFHRPNKYNLDSSDARKSIVFFIRGFKRDFESKVHLEHNWEDV
jgi:hypothetical protein